MDSWRANAARPIAETDDRLRALSVRTQEIRPHGRRRRRRRMRPFTPRHCRDQCAGEQSRHRQGSGWLGQPPCRPKPQAETLIRKPDPPNSARSASSSAWTFVNPASLLAIIGVGRSEFYAASRPSLAAYPTPTTRSESRRQAHKARMKDRAVWKHKTHPGVGSRRVKPDVQPARGEASSQGVNSC